jgi:short-subunit dehydrogenase
MHAKKSKGTAVVTGASSGIGAIYAERLARRGHNVVLVARNRERLSSLATKLKSETGVTVETLGADLSDASDLGRVEELLRSDEGIGVLVNNAGAGLYSPVMQSAIGTMENMIALNVTALVRLSYAAVQRFVQRGVGTLINISSVVALSPEMLNGVYSGSKAFVLAFSQSLRHELSGTGVRVQVVLPGATATEFWAHAGKPVEQLPAHIVMSAGDVVDAALSGLDSGEFVTIPALPNMEDWARYESARSALAPFLSRALPAQRYGLNVAR